MSNPEGSESLAEAKDEWMRQSAETAEGLDKVERLGIENASLRSELAEAKAENERLTEVAEQHEVELAFWKPGLAAWRLVTAPTDENLYRLACEADARLDGMAGEEGWRHILAALDRVVRAAQSREAQRPDPTS
jgi:hypothetical protein